MHRYRRPPSNRIRALLFCLPALLFAQGVMAAELVLYVFQNGAPLSRAEARLDEGQPRTIPDSGRVQFDLSGGNHQLQLLRDDSELHRMRFASGANQNADVIVRLPTEDGESVDTTVETYNPREAVGEREGEATGQLSGRIRSQETGAAISGARVSVPGSDRAAMTDANGSFSLALPRGVYDLEINHPEYGSRTLDDVRIVTSINQQVGYSMSLSGDGGPVEEVVATASYVPDTTTEQMRTSEGVLDVIGAEQIARFGDSNAAEAVSRSTGVNVAEGKFVFIRGLGGRYTTTNLNGASLPSTDPSRQTTPLDLFPADVLEQVNVAKTYQPDMPGGSAAGAVSMETRGMPEEDFFKISGSLSGNSRITGENEVVDPADGTFDFAGFDDGERELPALVEGLTARGRVQTENIAQFSPALVELMGESFERNLSPNDRTIPPGGGLSLSGGKRFDRGDNLFGLVAAVSYDNEFSIQDNGEETTFGAGGGSVVEDSSFDFTETTNTVEVSGLLAGTAELGLNHTFKSNTLISRVTDSNAKVSDGISADNNRQTTRFLFEYEERQFFSQQFAGEHVFPAAGNLEANWQYTHSRAERNAPDRREVTLDDEFARDPNEVVFKPIGTRRRFDDLDDATTDVSGDLTFPAVNQSNISTDLKAGFQISRRDRESETARFNFNFQGDIQDQVDLINQFTNPDELLAPENIDSEQFELRTLSTPSDFFTADRDTNAGYLMADAEYAGLLRAVAGFRVEDVEQTIDTNEVQSGDPVQAGFDETDVLPSLNLTWFMNPAMQLRFGVSKTLSRPDFKEQANATFFDPVFDFTVRGNPNLETSNVTSLDLRWEWFLNSTDNVTVGAFYKDLEQPIERVVIPSGGSGGGIRSFQNAGSGELKGIEVSGRKEFALDEGMSQTLFTQFNFAWIDSEVEVPEGSSERGGSRSLQGQPGNTLNLALGYDHLSSGQKVTLLFNRNGESIEDVGRQALPSVIQKPVHQVDLTYEKAFTEKLKATLEVQNLLDEETEFTQGGETFFSFKPGVSVSLGADWTF